MTSRPKIHWGLKGFGPQRVSRMILEGNQRVPAVALFGPRRLMALSNIWAGMEKCDELFATSKQNR